jgi:hypothetical protein
VNQEEELENINQELEASIVCIISKKQEGVNSRHIGTHKHKEPLFLELFQFPVKFNNKIEIGPEINEQSP